LTVRRTTPRAVVYPGELTPGTEPGTLGRPERGLAARLFVTGLVGRLRGRHLLVIDLLGILLAAYLALALRYDHVIGIDRFVQFLPIAFVLVAARLVSNIRFGLYSRGWRFASVPDLERIVAAVLVGSVAAFTTVYIASLLPDVKWTEDFPRSFWPAEALMAVAVLGGVRFAIRAASEWAPRSGPSVVAHRRRTLFYGAGHTGALMARSARRSLNAGVDPVGFLDDDPTLAGDHVANLRVFGGLEALDDAIAATRAETLLITMPSATGKTIRTVVDAAMSRGLAVRTVPSMNDLLDGTLDAYRVRRVQVEDLLRRTMGTEHAAAVNEIFRDRTVLITGAGGSIGSELARQVFLLGPRRLVIVDRAESALYIVQRELEGRRSRDESLGELGVHLANVASRPGMDRLISDEKPDVIFHAAALKHVPMMEAHPSEAVHVNIGGTLALLDAAAAAGVERFVLVSTDKAVRPSSVMGASKRVAEMLVADAAQRTGRPYVSVRFGNVLGSNGSVVPIFQEQLEKGEPLTITHPEMSRYFMTIAEASWLIVDASALGTSGDMFVLDMGDPIRIMDLARDLVRLAGRDPDTQPIEIVGLRPGEKLHEELFYDAERVEPTSIPKVLRASASPPPAQIREDVRQLLALATGEREDDLRIALLDYAGREVPQAADLPETSGPALQAVPIEVGDSPADLSDAVLAAMRAVPLDIGDPPQSASFAG
jgi:FlaA1/EpsC-like NDP-sugar epimerase